MTNAFCMMEVAMKGSTRIFFTGFCVQTGLRVGFSYTAEQNVVDRDVHLFADESGQQVGLVERSADMARTVQGYGHDGRWALSGIHRRSHGPCQFPGKYIAASQATVEFETLNQGVNRESIVQCSCHTIPRRRLHQA